MAIEEYVERLVYHPKELTAVAQELPSVPVQPILRKDSKPRAMIGHIERYPWVLPPSFYISTNDLLGNVKQKIIEPAEAMANRQRPGD
jgi:hypothetical protein